MSEVHPFLVPQMDAVRSKHPAATIEQLRHGAHVVVVPGVKLSERWTPRAVTLVLLLPPGFPGACPEHFWTQEDVRDAEERPIGAPRSSHPNNEITGYTGKTARWFSWRLQAWNPNSCTILTWLNTCRQRFEASPAPRWSDD